jgi:zinc protease
VFPAAELDRLKKQSIAGIRQEKADPNGIAGRLAPSLVYGESHPYAVASRVDEADVSALTPDSLAAHYRKWLRPDLGTLLVVGDTTLAKIVPLLEQRLAGWKAPAGAAPSVVLPAAPHGSQPRVFLVNRTGAEQSILLAGHSGVNRADPDFITLRAVNTVLGGSFLSRVNMNLREDKHWSYGARTQLSEAKGPGLFYVMAPVQTDKTAESLVEIRKELQDITTTRKPTDKEIAEAKATLTLTLPGNNETVAEVSGSYANILTFGLPENYYNEFVGKVGALSAQDFAAAASKLVDTHAITYLVVGDLEKIESKVRALNLGEVTVLDADGKKLR